MYSVFYEVPDSNCENVIVNPLKTQPKEICKLIPINYYLLLKNINKPWEGNQCGLAWSDIVLHILALNLSHPVISSWKQNKCQISLDDLSHISVTCVLFWWCLGQNTFSDFEFILWSSTNKDDFTVALTDLC